MSETHNLKRRMLIVFSTQNESDWLQAACIKDFTKSDVRLEAVEMSFNSVFLVFGNVVHVISQLEVNKIYRRDFL